jgi:FKBP-type peptidyl-prolyl cis-trans isomerase SlyD
MKIAAQCVVSFHYTLHDDAGQLLDASGDQQPLAYLHGSGNLIEGLERALEGRGAGETFDVAIEAGDAYGEHHGELVQEVARDLFPDPDAVAPGMAFEGETEDGPQSVRVVAVTDDTVTIDANHPLAGQRLNFHVEVVEVRPATQEELQHGHVHGPGGHHH